MRRHAAPYTRGFVSTNAAATHTHTSTHAVKHTRGFEAHRTQAIHHTLKSERGKKNSQKGHHKSEEVGRTDVAEVEGGRYVDFSLSDVFSGRGNIGRLSGPEGTRGFERAAHVSIRQHTSANVSIRQHTSAYVSIRQHTSACGFERASSFIGYRLIN